MGITDKKLLVHLKTHGIELIVFGFRWFFCFLIREFPLNLSIYLMDYLFLEDVIAGTDLLVFLVLGLLLKFSFEIQSLPKGESFKFLQNLPTFNWGYKDIDLLIAESIML